MCWIVHIETQSYFKLYKFLSSTLYTKGGPEPEICTSATQDQTATTQPAKHFIIDIHLCQLRIRCLSILYQLRKYLALYVLVIVRRKKW
jgi:hypothetical protein